MLSPGFGVFSKCPGRPDYSDGFLVTEKTDILLNFIK